MNIKKMMAALACAATVGFSAQAADWFNGGIGELWPTNAAMKNCEWSDSATNSSWNATEERVDIKLDGATLACEAPSKGVGGNVDSVTFDSVVGFSAYDVDGLPAIPESAKAAVTYVATNEDATAGQFYYLAYNDASGVESNEWKASGVYSDITGGFSAAQGTEVTIAQGEDGFWAVKYVFKGDYPKTFDVAVKKNGSTDYVSTMEFAGNGPGYVTKLEGTYAEKTVAITVDNDSYENVTVTNVMWNGKLYGIDGFRLPEGAENIKVLFEAKEGYKFTDEDFTLIASPIIVDFEINADNVPAPETIETSKTITFYDANFNVMTNYAGTPGTPWTYAADVNALAQVRDNNKVGCWFEQWLDGEETPVELPAVYPNDNATYVMGSTTIVYRVGFDKDYKEIVVGIGETEDVEEYTVDDDYLGATAKPSRDLDKDDDPAGREFIGWTCEYFGLTQPMMTADEAWADYCTMPESFDAWENVGDIIFVANWEEAPAQPFYVVSGGETNGYDSFADAYGNLSDGGIIVVGNSDAAIEDDFQFNEEIAWTADLNGKTLTIGDGCVLYGNLTVVDSSSSKAGSLAINGKFLVGDDAVLDLSGLTYAQTEECTGSFTISYSGKLYFPSDVTYPDCKKAIKDAEDGAKIVVGGTTYTKSGALWVVGTTGKAVAKIGTTGYETLDAAIAAAKADDTVALLKDIETDVKEPWTISKNIELDFDNYTITKKVSNDWVFTIAKGADVTFTGLNGGISFNPIEAGNKDNPASMVQIFGKLTVDGGKYSSDFTIFKVDEDGGCSAAGELFVSNGTFEIVDAEDYEGPQWAVMNWSTATIEGGDWYGVIGTRSSDTNKTVKAGQTTIGDNVSGEPEFLLYVGYKGDTTCNNLPKIKGVDVGDVNLEQTSTITDELELVEDGEWVTVQKAKFDVTFEDGENSTITPAAGTSNFVYGTQLTITATAAKDYVFKTFGAEWTPNAESNVLTQVATITAADTFTAPDAEKAAPEPEPIDPSKGGEIPCENPQAATNLAAAITANPSQYVKAPTGLDATAAAIYQSFFKAEVAADGTTVKLMLNGTGETALQGVADEATDDPDIAAALCDPTAKSITYADGTYFLGFYYWVAGGTDVKALTTDAEAVQPTAYGDMELDKPDLGETTQGFYVIKVDFKDPAK